MTKHPSLVQARKRLFEDFEFWARHSCKVRTKEGEIKPFILNRVQRRFLQNINDQLKTTGRIRAVILKGRQQGLSTFVHAYIYWWVSQRVGQKGLVIAHESDSTQALFDMYQRTHENLPILLKPETKFSSKKELRFAGLDSGLVVATAGGKSIARGETLQCMHLSEVGFWQSTFANANFNGLIQALPELAGTMCFVESTANGVGNKFNELWDGAVAGVNGFVPFFSAWFESDEYRTIPPPAFERSPEEGNLAELFGLDDEQLYWRRRKIALDGLDLFNQEYPCTPEEAFLTSGRPVFDLHALQSFSQNARPILKRLAVEEGKVIDHPLGELRVYHERVEGETYFIGADVSVGIKNPEKSDWCVAQILDGQKRQVSVWRGQVTPDHYARVLAALGYYYNVAMVAPERNGHGLLVCVRLWKDLNYPNCFMDLKEGEIADRETLAIGFQTNVSSKPLIIDKLREAIRQGDIEISDEITLKEMRTFVVTDSGKMEAEAGSYDDAVLSLAICNHIHEGKFTPINVTDDYYTVAI